MTAPIRDMAGLVEALKAACLERGISYRTAAGIAGLSDAYVEKLFAHKPMKNLGYQSTGELLGALGKMIVVLDDPEMIARVQGRWKQRRIVGGSAIQMREMQALLASSGTSSGIIDISAHMRAIRKLVKRENLVKAGKNGGKRRMKMMKKRSRQAMAQHAARKRWAKTRHQAD